MTAKLQKAALPEGFEDDYKAGKLDYTALAWKYTDLGPIPDCMIANSILTKSDLAARTEAFGEPDFMFQGFEYQTSCWLLKWEGKQLLMISAEGRGTSYEMCADDLPERYGFNVPAFWGEFCKEITEKLAATESGQKTLSHIMKSVNAQCSSKASNWFTRLLTRKKH